MCKYMQKNSPPDVPAATKGESPPGLSDEGKQRKLYCPFSSPDPELQNTIDNCVAREMEKQQKQIAPEESGVPSDLKAFLDEMVNPYDFLETGPEENPPSPPTFQAAYGPNSTLGVTNASPPIVAPTFGRMIQFGGGMTASAPPSVMPDRGTHAESEYALMDKAASMVSFVVARHRVHLYNGIHYEEQSSDEVAGVILDLCRDDAIRIGKYSPIKNACKLMEIDNRFQSPQKWFDAGKRYVTFLNGNLDLETGQLVPHSPSIFTTFSIKANYLGPGCGAETPVFDQVLLRAGGGDPWFTERVFQMFGYVFTADIQGKCGFLLQGVTNSGKSLLCNFLSSFFPEDKVAAIALHNVGDRFSTAELEGAALCITPDLPSSPLSEKAAGMVKALTGNDLIQADRKYQKHTKFRFEGKFLMGTNHALLTKGHDPAFADRLVVLPFLYSIPRAEWDNRLLDKLKLERDAVASKAMDAYFRLRQNSYVFAGEYPLNLPAAVGQSVQCQYLTPELVDQYVRACYEPSPSGRVFALDAYTDFCLKSGSNPERALFGKYFIEAAGRCFGAVHERKRRIPGGNPVSSVVGLCRKPEE